MATDQEIRDAGLLYIPKQKYLQNPYNLPVAPPTEPVPGGITNTNAFTNSGGANDNFNPAGNAFGYGSPVSEVNVRTFNPQELPGAEMPSELGFSNNTVPLGNNKISSSQLGINLPGGQVQNTYTRARNAMNIRGDDTMSRDYPDFTAADVARLSNNSIQDYRQNYGAQGQYNSPYEDSIDLGYQGTLGNKGMLNRFKNKIGDAAKFVGGLLPFPLNIATKFLPQRDDNGPGGGTYGIAGLSDAQKEQYNTLAGQGMLFNGQNGFKTLTGKNFNAKNYAQGQIDIYNKKGYDKYTVDEDDVYDAKGKKLTGFLKKQYLEASAMYKITEKQRKEEEATKAANDLRFKQEQDRLDGLVGTTVIDRNTGTSSVVENESGGNDPGTSRRSDHAQAAGLGSNAGNVRAANTAGTGSAQSYNQNLADGGRAGYFFGGRVNYKKGGKGRTDAGPNRTTASKAGVGQINESGQKVSGGNFNNNNDGGDNNNPPVTVVENQNSIFDTSGLKSKSPEINIDYTNPKNYASLKSRIYNTNILDNDNINVDGTLSGEIGPVSYNTNFTDQGITNTNLKAGNFTTNLNPDMKVQDIGYANNYNGIDYGVKYDNNGNLMLSAGVNFKNGGLASIL